MIPLGLYRTEKVQFSSSGDEETQKTRRKTVILTKNMKEDEKKEIQYVITNPSKKL